MMGTLFLYGVEKVSIASVKTGLAQEMQADVLYGFSMTSFDAYEKPVARHLRATTHAVSQNGAVGSEPPLAISIENRQSFLQLQSQHLEATTQKAQAYRQRIAEIATRAQSQLLQVSQLLVAEYVRANQVLRGSLGVSWPTANNAIASIWLIGFAGRWNAGTNPYEKTTPAPKEAEDVISQ